MQRYGANELDCSLPRRLAHPPCGALWSDAPLRMCCDFFFGRCYTTMKPLKQTHTLRQSSLVRALAVAVRDPPP